MNDTDVKQVIILKKNVGMRRAKAASYIARASLQFLVENDVSDRKDAVQTSLSLEESLWLRNGQKRDIYVIDSYDTMSDIVFKAKVLNIDAYAVFDNKDYDDLDESTPVCIALGPASSEELAKFTSKLKRF